MSKYKHRKNREHKLKMRKIRKAKELAKENGLDNLVDLTFEKYNKEY